MKLVIDIKENNLAEGMSVLKQLDFINSISEFQSTPFEEKWAEGSNLKLSEANRLTKNKVRELWTQK